MNRKETAEGEMDGEEKGMGKRKRREGGTMLLFPDQKKRNFTVYRNGECSKFKKFLII